MVSQGRPVDDSAIGDQEIIWRRVAAADVIYDDNLQRKRPTSACFLQDGPDGPISVYVASQAVSPETVLAGAKEPFLVAVTARLVRELDLGITFDSSSGGPGHALLNGRKTRSKSGRLAKEAVWVDPYGPP